MYIYYYSHYDCSSAVIYVMKHIRVREPNDYCTMESRIVVVYMGYIVADDSRRV